MQIKEAIIHAAHTASQKIRAAAHTVSGVFCCRKTNAVVEAAPIKAFIGPKPAITPKPFDLASAQVAEVLASQAKRRGVNTPQAKMLAHNLQWPLLQIPQDGDESPSLHDRLLALRRAQLTELTAEIADLESQVAKEMAARFGQDDVAPQGDLEIVKL